MAANSKVFVSPGVYTSERDLSFVAQSVGVTTLGIVGETLKGPAFEPIFITNYDEFQAYFGGTSPEKFINTQIPKYEASYIAKSYLQQSNQLFVTRILGLSGYDAGPSWSIQTIGGVDPSTVAFSAICVTTPNFTAGTCDTSCTGFTSPLSIPFTGCSDSEESIFLDLSGVPTALLDLLNLDYNPLLGGDQVILDSLKSQLMDIFIDPTLSASSINYFGTVDGSYYTANVAAGYTDETNVFNVPSVSSYSSDITSPANITWYNALFTSPSPGVYTGMSFYSVVSSLVGITNPYVPTTTTTVPGPTTTTTLNPCDPIPTGTTTSTTSSVPANCFSGTITGNIFYFSGATAEEYDNMVIATLRSRGISIYSSSHHGPVYEVDNLANVSLDFSGSYSAALVNPFATFGVNVTNTAGTTFFFETSLAPSSANFIEKVFGNTNFGKPRNETPLFVEENFSALLSYGFRKGLIKGIKSSLIALPGARNDNGTGIGNYLEKYQTPESPWVVSELRGTKVYRLFKFISIADGNSANTQIKISIVNISFDSGNFDILVRDFNDTDDSPVVLEKFSNCTMDPELNSFVAKKIGSSDGDYPLISKYVMIQLSDDAPDDALPCGFEGYKFRTYYGGRSPFPNYKVKYDMAGDPIYYPPGGGVQLSSGDNVRRTYLGFSDSIGYDPDMLQYYGKKNLNTVPLTTCDSILTDWNYITKGFHLDSGATVCTIPDGYVNSGDTAFFVGVASFTEDPSNQNNPYYRIYARKFTMMVSGGFDAWDIYREYRTNGDNYSLGAPGFLNGACFSTRYPNANGQGTFRVITIEGDTVNWGTTDYYAYLLGQRTFSNAQAYNINVFVTPGIDYVNNEQLVKKAIDMIEYDRADSLYITTTPDWEMFVPVASDFADFVYPQDAVDSLYSTNIDSNYTCTYYPWVLMRDTVNNTQIYLPPTAEVTRNLALTDNIAFPWFASAGYTRGIVNAIKARKKLTQEDRDTLYIGRINPIATFSDVGTVIWGNKTLQMAESALDRINVRRLLLQARKLISAVAVRLLFEQNDAKVRQDFLDAVNPILDAIRRDRGLYDFRVTVSSTPEDLDRNQLVGKIYIKPTKSLEFIDIEFLITPTGASFENI